MICIDESTLWSLFPSPIKTTASATCVALAISLALYFFLDLPDHPATLKGCRKIGLHGRSNLADEHDEQYSKAGQVGGIIGWSVKSLWIYPIKSCKGVELDQATVFGSGMKHDRQFSFAQSTGKVPLSGEGEGEHQWSFITQRRYPKMANIKTEVWVPDPSSPEYSKRNPWVRSEGVIVITFPSSMVRNELNEVEPDKVINGLNEVEPDKVVNELGELEPDKVVNGLGEVEPDKVIYIPFNPTKKQILKSGYTVRNMKIWKDNPGSLLITSTEDLESWINDLRVYLEMENDLALFRVSSKHPRNVKRCAPKRNELGYQPTVGFQDAYPLHILNLASVHDVANKIDEGAPQLGVRNFRPNIVMTGGEAYSEDSWKRITIGDYHYHVSCRTVRCLLPNVNPATGEKHKSEPNNTLLSFRRIDEGHPSGACLGMQMVPASQNSQIKVGDTIKVLETGAHFYLKQ